MSASLVSTEQRVTRVGRGAGWPTCVRFSVGCTGSGSQEGTGVSGGTRVRRQAQAVWLDAGTNALAGHLWLGLCSLGSVWASCQRLAPAGSSRRVSLSLNY